MHPKIVVMLEEQNIDVTVNERRWATIMQNVIQWNISGAFVQFFPSDRSISQEHLLSVEDAKNILNNYKHMKTLTNKFCWNCCCEPRVSKNLYCCAGCRKGWYCGKDCHIED